MKTAKEKAKTFATYIFGIPALLGLIVGIVISVWSIIDPNQSPFRYAVAGFFLWFVCGSFIPDAEEGGK